MTYFKGTTLTGIWIIGQKGAKVGKDHLGNNCINPVRHDVALYQGSSSEGDDEQMNSGYILKVELTGFIMDWM